MRILLTVPLLLLAACNASHDDANNQVNISYDEETARNTLEGIGNTAENVGGAIVNDVQEEVDRAQNTDVDVDVNTNAGDGGQR